MEDRVIGRYTGRQPGPLLICIGGMHGNEPSGIQAIEEVFRLLQNEPSVNPQFSYTGTIVGLRGNLAAIRLKQRYIFRDLNRMLLEEELERIHDSPEELLTPEDRECRDLILAIRREQDIRNPTLTLILDLHTTTADGGVFTIAEDDPLSMSLAKGLYAPVILGISTGLRGTTMDFFNRPKEKTYCIVFEAGQHEDPEGINRSVAAMVNCMRSIGSVDPGHVDHLHDGILKKISVGQPRVSRLVFHYRIRKDEEFVMKPGYQNFHPILAGEVVASNQHGKITAPVGGLMLMPKYQSQGDDGFFIVAPIE